MSPRSNFHVMFLVTIVALAGYGCSKSEDKQLETSGAELELADAKAATNIDWAAYGGTADQAHYSPADQIDTANVGRLGLAWSFDLPAGNTLTQPIAVNGVLYFASGYSVLHAIDAITGKLLWKYDPEVYKTDGRQIGTMGWGSRGIAWWKDKVYTVTQGGVVIAVDAKTGKALWSSPTLAEDSISFVTGPPRVFAGKVIVGNSGDNGPVRGHVVALDAGTGELAWRFYVVPGNPADGFENEAMERAAKTWSGEWWKYGGGGTPWNSFSYDSETELVFVGTGNGYPYNHRLRSAGEGDNLYLSSIVALDVHSGEYRWHYQTTPADNWDYTAVQDLELADLEIDGELRKVLMTAPKNGFYYVLDRVSGELISAEPFVKVNWASRIDMETGRPVENPGVRYENKPFTVWPSAFGGHNWQPMAYSPKTRLAYIPAAETGSTYTDTRAVTTWNPPDEITSGALIEFNIKSDDPKEGTAALLAWDPVKQEAVWRVQAPRMIPAGIVATAGGLVFQGSIDSTFNGYSATDGKLLWTYDTRAPAIAPPISYAVDGRQYVTVFTGMGSILSTWGTMLLDYKLDYNTLARRVLSFTLDGDAALPPKTEPIWTKIEDPTYAPDPESAAAGELVYLMNRCVICHGYDAVAGGFAPDLRRSPILQSEEAFINVVRDGALAVNGMPESKGLTADELSKLRQYLRAKAQDPSTEQITKETNMIM